MVLPVDSSLLNNQGDAAKLQNSMLSVNIVETGLYRDATGARLGCGCANGDMLQKQHRNTSGNFSAPRYVTSISRGRCGSAICFTSLWWLWEPPPTGAGQRTAASLSCTSQSVKEKSVIDTGGTWRRSVTGVRPPQPPPPPLLPPLSSTERPSNMAPSGAPGNAKHNDSDRLITSHSMF